MKALKFSIEINAPPEKVWNVLWSDETYVKWVKVFSEDSKTISDWIEGEPITFLDSKGNGMQSKINIMAPPEFMEFQHLRLIRDGKVQPSTPESKKWEGALESYKLIEKNGYTLLLVKMDSAKDYIDFFNERFPKALKIIKDLSEENKV